MPLPPRSSAKSITVTLALLLGACAPKTQEGAPSGAPSGGSCEVRGSHSLLNFRAQVRGNASTASRSILKTKAHLDGNAVVYHHSLTRMEAGLIEGSVAHLTLLTYDSESTPIVDGATELPISPAGSLRVTSQGCTTRDVAFGTLHIAAMFIMQRAQNSM